MNKWGQILNRQPYKKNIKCMNNTYAYILHHHDTNADSPIEILWMLDLQSTGLTAVHEIYGQGKNDRADNQVHYAIF